MFRIIASVLVALAIAIAWLLSQDSAPTAKKQNDNGGIKFNSVGEVK